MTLFTQREDSPAYNIFFRLSSPIIFIILFSTLYYSLKLNTLVHNIWIIVPLYFSFRILYNIALNKWQLINKIRELSISLVATVLSYVIYINFISIKENLLPSRTDLSEELWVIIILYLYNTFNKIEVSTTKSEKRRNHYYRAYYIKFKREYGKLIAQLQVSPILESLIYSVMIYENFNRPPFIRFFERIVFPLFSTTLGIMQVKTNKRITDNESVEIGANILKNKYLSALPITIQNFKNQGIDNPPVDEIVSATSEAIFESLKEYNKDDNYISDVAQLHKIIIEAFYPQIQIIW